MSNRHSQTIRNYHVIFEEQTTGGYTITVPSLPGCISEGDTFEEAKSNINEAISLYIESLLIDGLEVPQDTPVIVDTIPVKHAMNLAV